MKFEIRQLDAWRYEDDRTINTSYHLGDMCTDAQSIPRAFCAWMQRHARIRFFRGRTRVEYDGDCYIITDRKTHEPLFIAIPYC